MKQHRHSILSRFASLVLLILNAAIPASALAQLQPNAAWPKFLGNASNTGGYFGYCSSGTLRWKYPLQTEVSGSVAISANNTVYMSNNGNLLALDGALGTLKWSTNFGASTSNAPAIGSNGLIYVCDTVGGVHAFGAAFGNEVWSYTVPSGDSIEGSPTIGPAGTLYFCCDDGNLYAVNGTTGKLIWTFHTTAATLMGTPALSPDGLTIYFGADNDYLYAVDNTGHQSWSFKADSQIYSSPVVGSDGMIYITTYGGHVYAVNALGTQQWVFTGADGAIYGSVALGNYNVYFATSHGTLYAITSGGVGPEWTYALGGIIVQTPVVETDGTVIVNNQAGTVVAVEPIMGSEVWSYSTPDTVSEAGQLAMAKDGALFFGASDLYLYALDGAMISNFYASSANVTGGQSLTGVVQLTQSAGANGQTVQIKNYFSELSVPASVFIPAGKLGVSFQIQTNPVSSHIYRTLVARLSNGVEKSCEIGINPAPVSNLYFFPSSITGGTSTFGVVQLGGKAGPSGDVVALSGGALGVTYPGTVTVPAGGTGVSFMIQTTPVSSDQTVQFTATLGTTSKTASVTVKEAILSNFYTSPSTVTGGHSTTGVVQLNGKAGALGDNVTIQSNSTSVVPPSTVIVPAGSTGKSFSITTKPVSISTPVTLTATLGATIHITLTVNPYPISNFYVQPAITVGGFSTHGVVQLAGVAGPTGDVVSLKSSDSHVVVPASVTVPAGGTGKSFAITTKAVSATLHVTLTATLGTSSKQTTVTLNP